MQVPRKVGFWLLPLAVVSVLSLTAAMLPAPAEAQSPRTVRPNPGKPYAKRVLPRRNATPAVAPNPNVAGRDAMLLIDAESGRELEAHAADELRHPASLTKIMTLYLAFSALDAGQLRLSGRVPVSVRAGSVQPSKIGAPVGSTLMVRDAIMGLITRSANDAAVVLAEAIAGDEDAFAQLMTQKARQLGMASTVFRNASGLPDTWQVTTARDLSRLAQALLRDFPHYYPLFAARSWSIGRFVLTNHNRMLTTYAGADGIKTGYINASGFNLVMSAVRDNRRLIGVVLGGSSVWERDEVMADMMDRGFDKARALGLPAWQQLVAPASARYAAVNFTPGPPPAEPQRHVARPFNPPNGKTIPDLLADASGQVPAATTTTPPAPVTSRTPAQGSRAADAPGGWAIQLGAPFPSRPAASAALRTALARLPDLRDDARPNVEAIKGPRGQVTYRARLMNLDEQDAARGCQSLKASRVFFCTSVPADGRAD
jgi:D-alanyl-D-alanine carboxypeptidase